MSSAARRRVPPPGQADTGPPAGAAALRAVGPEPSIPSAPRRHRGGRRLEMVRRAVAEVEALRPLLEEAVAQYELRITAQLAEVLRALRGESASLLHLPPVKTTSAMLRSIRALEIKPERGRAKDLVRLHELVAELTELITTDP